MLLRVSNISQEKGGTSCHIGSQEKHQVLVRRQTEAGGGGRCRPESLLGCLWVKQGRAGEIV